MLEHFPFKWAGSGSAYAQYTLAKPTEGDRYPVGRAGFKPVGTRQACLVGSTPTLFRHSSVTPRQLTNES